MVGNDFPIHILHHVSLQLKYLRSVPKQWYSARMKVGVPQPFCSSAEGNGCRSSGNLLVFYTLGTQSSLHCQPAQQKGDRHRGQLKESQRRFCRVQKCLNQSCQTIFPKDKYSQIYPPQTNINMYQKENTVLSEGCSNLFETGLDKAALQCLIYNDETDDVK